MVTKLFVLCSLLFVACIAADTQLTVIEKGIYNGVTGTTPGAVSVSSNVVSLKSALIGDLSYNNSFIKRVDTTLPSVLSGVNDIKTTLFGVKTSGDVTNLTAMVSSLNRTVNNLVLTVGTIKATLEGHVATNGNNAEVLKNLTSSQLVEMDNKLNVLLANMSAVESDILDEVKTTKDQIKLSIATLSTLSTNMSGDIKILIDNLVQTFDVIDSTIVTCSCRAGDYCVNITSSGLSAAKVTSGTSVIYSPVVTATSTIILQQGIMWLDTGRLLVTIAGTTIEYSVGVNNNMCVMSGTTQSNEIRLSGELCANRVNDAQFVISQCIAVVTPYTDYGISSSDFANTNNYFLVWRLNGEADYLGYKIMSKDPTRNDHISYGAGTYENGICTRVQSFLVKIAFGACRSDNALNDIAVTVELINLFHNQTSLVGVADLTLQSYTRANNFAGLQTTYNVNNVFGKVANLNLFKKTEVSKVDLANRVVVIDLTLLLVEGNFAYASNMGTRKGYESNGALLSCRPQTTYTKDGDQFGLLIDDSTVKDVYC